MIRKAADDSDLQLYICKITQSKRDRYICIAKSINSIQILDGKISVPTMAKINYSFEKVANKQLFIVLYCILYLSS